MLWGPVMPLLSLAGSSLTLTGLSSRKTFWSLSMVTTRCCSVSWLTERVLGMATSMPDCRTGAVSMKITSSTSTTSTSGVMLISASAVCVWPFLFVKATCGLPFNGVLVGHEGDFFHAVQQFARKIVHTRGKAAQAPRELVVGNHRRNSHKQPSSRCDQSL